MFPSDFFLKFSREPVLYCVYIYKKKTKTPRTNK